MNALDIEQIRADDRCQPRATFDTQLVEQYAEAMARGDVFPPVKVFFDGADHFLADGFHRYHAAKSLGLVDISADVSNGTLRDAILFSCSANAAHGWRRTNDDKRRAVLRLLNDPEWQNWSDREIARRCGVGHPLVATLRPAPTNTGISSSMDRTFIHPKTGQETQMRTANIGNRPVGNAPAEQVWDDIATPRARADVQDVNQADWMGAIWEVLRHHKDLSQVPDAGARVPNALLHSLNVNELDAVADWFATFASAIRNRKEPRNVAT